jgi:uncharacterized protein YndB with AHSA1/START domain
VVGRRDRRRTGSERLVSTRVEGEIVINRPVDEVFDFVADERNEPRFNPHMVSVTKISDGPVEAGTRFAAEISTRGRTQPMTIELTECVRPRRLSSTTHLAAMDIIGTLRFEPVAAGTRMRWSWELAPRGRGGRLLLPLIAPIGRRQERTTWAGLKRVLEADITEPRENDSRRTPVVRDALVCIAHVAALLARGQLHVHGMVNPSTSEYAGLYSWATVAGAQRYGRYITAILRPWSAVGSVGYEILPALTLDEFLAHRHGRVPRAP